jgi:murein DD-endopeptidase MepM/ murein hydrolase activator NlpD
MNLKWTKKKLTLVVIPDVNRSVVRLRIPNMIVYAAALILMALILVTLTMYVLHTHSLSITSKLKNQLAVASSQLTDTVSTKDQAIQQLQNEVIQLSQQADLMKTKVDEMKKLESDLKTITGVGSADKSSKDIAAPADPSKLPIQGEGGSLIPVTQEEILKLGDHTEAAMSALSQEMDGIRSNFTVTKQQAQEKQNLLRVTPTIWPTTSKIITSGFGYRRDPLTRTPSFHAGIDIGASENEPVYAAADGKVITTGQDIFHGNNIVIDHSSGLHTWYMHLNKIMVNEGDTVSKGQTIGLVGSTGRSTGPHLHYEVQKNGTSIDPTPYLQTTRKDDR